MRAHAIGLDVAHRLLTVDPALDANIDFEQFRVLQVVQRAA